MKKLIKYTIASALAITLGSCTDNFETINSNPHEITDAQLKQQNYHIGASFAPMFLNVFNVTPAWNYQLQQGLMGDVFSGYMTAPTPFAGNVNNQTYALVDGWNGFPWADAYTSVMPFALEIKTILDEEQNPESETYRFIANIIKVAAMHRVSDIYGPIRYTKYDAIATTGIYDSQEVAYTAFFNDLTTAIDGLESFAASGDKKFSLFDMSTFAGDLGKWRTFANSLRLRLAMRIVNVNPELAKTQGELALASNAGFLEVENMVVNTGFAHPISVISGSWGDVRMGAEMEAILTGFNDGRIDKYFAPATDANLNGVYKGVRMGIEIEAKTQYGAHSAVGAVIDGETIQWMSAAEVFFLRAEAALRGWANAGTAQANYENGVTASFSQHGVSGISSYLADDTSTPADFVDALNAANNIEYASEVKIAYNAAGSNEEQLEQIITQKWIGMFPDGQEAWSEFRRTGYPRIFPVVVNNSGGEIDTNIQVRRINFVDSEVNTNGANVTTAVGYLNGPDTGGTRLWWDVSGSNF
ncbi:RagB/SusD family nutrient uptake outer membrane protein [Flavicella sediminum]|uniref:RagB/SusD family nutrient uptake outer membrane protein n=1 Tax=Flavicella sediminum TaxID=2585141 RepID=UPI001120AA52|nr:RagB/SusD family nutrient uptake outer membrane protein [Flavicella sediminum]